MDKRWTFNPSRRFWGFAFKYYYPTGGLGDLSASFDDEAAAIAWMNANDDLTGTCELLDREKMLKREVGDSDWKPVDG